MRRGRGFRSQGFAGATESKTKKNDGLLVAAAVGWVAIYGIAYFGRKT